MPVDMLPHILRYFRAEKDAGLYVLIVGAVIIMTSAWIWWSRWRYRALVVPLSVIAVIEIIVGCTLYFGSDAQIDRLTGQYYSEREVFAVQETTRMERVVTSFAAYKLIEAALIVLGAGFAIVYRKRPTVVGVGVGLAVQAAIMLGFDILAAERAQVYLEALWRS